MVSVCDCLDDGEVVHCRHGLTFQQEVRLLIQKAVFRQYHILDLIQQISIILEELQIFRHAASHGILFHCLVEGQVLNGVNLCERQRSQPHLRGSASVQRTVIGQCVFLHHAD